MHIIDFPYKAGGIPFHIDPVTKQISVVLFTSSNPRFGGKDPAIAKGIAGANETPNQTARREIREETGIIVEKDFLLSQDLIVGLHEKYPFFVFGIPMSSQIDLVGSFEGIPSWYSETDALREIRPTHKHILELLLSRIKSVDSIDTLC